MVSAAENAVVLPVKIVDERQKKHYRRDNKMDDFIAGAQCEETIEEEYYIWAKYGYIIEGKSPSTKILGVPANEDTFHYYD